MSITVSDSNGRASGSSIRCGRLTRDPTPPPPPPNLRPTDEAYPFGKAALPVAGASHELSGAARTLMPFFRGSLLPAECLQYLRLEDFVDFDQSLARAAVSAGYLDRVARVSVEVQQKSRISTADRQGKSSDLGHDRG